MEDNNVPIFQQVAELIEDAILAGSLTAGAQAPSTNELAAFHLINPATARKGISRLVEDGVLEKRRGLGMFVSEGAAEIILRKRRHAFARQYVEPLLAEASKLGISQAELQQLIAQSEKSEQKSAKQKIAEPEKS